MREDLGKKDSGISKATGKSLRKYQTKKKFLSEF